MDLERCSTWHLTETKNRRAHSIYRSAFAIEQFQRLADLRETAGDGTPEVTCVKSFGKQLADRQRELERRLLNRARHTKALALQGGRWTAHDLRRTAATLMAELGVSGDVIENHMIESRARRVYIRDRRIAAQARAFDLLGAELKAIAALRDDARPRRHQQESVGVGP